MRRLLSLFIITAFLSPGFTPLAQAGLDGIFLDSSEAMAEDCEHGDACPMKYGGKHGGKHKKAARAAGNGNNDSEKNAAGDDRDLFIHCAGANSGTPVVSTQSIESLFVTGRTETPAAESLETTLAEGRTLYSGPTSEPSERPPAVR
ncbi:MAG: hypothetical protein V3W31_04810 [Thermodesulfobacteriota bacterium]